MASTTQDIALRAGGICRVCVSALIAGVWRRRSVKEIETDIGSRPALQQVAIITSVIALLLALSLFAAQFGWIGMLVFWIAIIVLVN